MPQYFVTVPATMSVSIAVEADNEKAAINAALSSDFGLKIVGEDAKKVEIGDWQMHSIIAKGNICHAVQNEIYVEEA